MANEKLYSIADERNFKIALAAMMRERAATDPCEYLRDALIARAERLECEADDMGNGSRKAA